MKAMGLEGRARPTQSEILSGGKRVRSPFAVTW